MGHGGRDPPNDRGPSCQRSYDDMYHAHVNVTYLTQEDYEQIAAERRAKQRTNDQQ